MSASFTQRRLRRLTLFPLASILALSACGSGHSGATPPSNPPMGYAYVTSAGPSSGSAGAVYEYALRIDGSASPLAQSSIGAGINPAAIAVKRSGGYVYVVNAGDGSISQYAIASDSTLTAMNPAAVTNPGMHTFGSAGAAATIDPTGGFLYVVNTADATISQFSIGADGQLTPLTPSTVATGTAPVSIVATPTGVYVVNSGAPGDAGSVSQYTESSNGTLAPTGTSPVAAGTNPTVLSFGDSSTAYVLSNCDGTQCTGSIRQFGVGTDGALTDTGAIATTGSHYRAAGMLFDQNGVDGYAYVLTNEVGVDTQSGALWSYQVASSGGLTAASPPSFSVPGVALSQDLVYGSLFVLTTNSGAEGNAAATGGSLISYVLGDDGAVTPEATTQLTAPNPTAMGVWVLLPP